MLPLMELHIRFDSDGAGKKDIFQLLYSRWQIMLKSMMPRIINIIIWKSSLCSIRELLTGQVSDLDLLAAVCDAEAGDQGVDGNGGSCALRIKLYH